VNTFNWRRPHLRIPVLFALFGCVGLSAGCASPPARQAISVDEVVAMAGEGLPADAIIEKIQASRSVYPLPASRLLDLKQKGVPDQVLDYMEQTYLTEACRQAIWDESGELYTASTIEDCY
jgi:hypothetical protein